METTNNQPPKQSNTNKVLILLIALLTVVCGVLFWLYLDQKKVTQTEIGEKKEVIDEKDAVTKELENMLQQYDALQSDNTALQSEMDAQKQRITDLLSEVEKYKGSAAMMSKYKKETETLRTIMRNYVATIDSLNTLNLRLNEENVEVKKELGTQVNKYQELNKVKEDLTKTVKQASVLSTAELKGTGVYYKSGGKEVETNKAGRTEKIKTCFTLGENKITKPGPKEIFVRIISPQGKILAEGADENYMFEYEGIQGVYSSKKTIDYQNQKQTVCSYFEVKQGEELPGGKYVAQVYSDGVNIGTVNFELK